MALEPRLEHRRRMEREAELERQPGDPTATKPRDVRRIGLIVTIGLLLGIAALVGMFANNTRYDGAGPVPVEERR